MVCDGSINTEYAEELSELIPLLTNLWLSPSIYPVASTAILLNKFICICTMLDVMGVSLINDELRDIVEHYFKVIENEN